MTTIEFLKDLKQQQIAIRLKDNDQLGINSPNGRIDADTLKELKLRKSAIIELLKEAQSGQQGRIQKTSEQSSYNLTATPLGVGSVQ